MASYYALVDWYARRIRTAFDMVAEAQQVRKDISNLVWTASGRGISEEEAQRMRVNVMRAVWESQERTQGQIVKKGGSNDAYMALLRRVSEVLK